MTIRDRLTSQLNKARAVAIGSWVMLAASIMFSEKHDKVSPFVMIPFTFFLGSVVYMMFGINCPRCETGLGHQLNWPRKTNFCPHCGVNLDEEMHGHKNSSQRTSEQERDAASGTDRFV